MHKERCIAEFHILDKVMVDFDVLVGIPGNSYFSPTSIHLTSCRSVGRSSSSKLDIIADASHSSMACSFSYVAASSSASCLSKAASPKCPCLLLADGVLLSKDFLREAGLLCASIALA